MQLFPYTLIRLGGDSFEQWSSFNFSKSNAFIEEVYLLQKKQQHIKEVLCDKLFQFISENEDAELQNIVQNLRRDIFNERKLKNSKVNKALDLISGELKTLLQEYIALLATLKDTELAGEEIFNKDLNSGRKILKKLVDTEYLKKGLILSSRTLLDRLDSFNDRPVETFRKKEHQVEQSLLQYLTRMYTKTSPFSTFTNLSVGTMGNVEEGIKLTALNSSGQVKGHVRLNNYLLKYLMDLLRNYRAAYLLFPLRCNPTVQNRGDHFLYLTNNNNIEAFQRIPYNPVVEHIVEQVQNCVEGIRFSELILTLQNDIEASADELENYIKQLVDYGLLEYHLGVSGVDPDWDVKLAEALSYLVDKKVLHIEELSETLADMRLLGSEYGSSDVERRKNILQAAYDTLRNICMKIHAEAGLPADERKSEKERIAEWKTKREEEKKKQVTAEIAEDKPVGEELESDDKDKKEDDIVFTHKTSTFFSFKPEQIFYEDTTREIEAELDKSQVEGIVSELHELLNQMRFFQGNQDEKEKMKNYFLDKYGADEKTDLLTFYEDYFRELKKPEKEREEKKKQELREADKLKTSDNESKESVDGPVESVTEPFDVKKKNEQIKNWKEAVLDVLRLNYSSDQDIINIDLEVLKKANSISGFNDTQEQTNSYGSFLQFFHEEGQLKAVVNGAFPGHGKMMSRFLHIFDPDITSCIRDWNVKQCDDEAVFIEDCDASYFNANLHPTLMPNEVWMPGGHNSLPPDKQIPITDFEILYDSTEESLNLVQKSSGKKAYVFDLGFQGHQGRSQLFQLLEKFTKAEYLSTQPLTNIVNQGRVAETVEGQSVEQQIKIFPRIVYKGLLVLQRKSWIVPKVMLPERGSMDSDWQFFKKVNLWRKVNKIPDEVFVFVNTNRWGSDNMEPELLKKITKDDYKPQYIDFTNPLLVSLLEKLIDRVPMSMKLEEMLPGSSQMMKIDGSRYVSEFVVQWYSSNENKN